MTAENYARLALIFAVVAVLQLARAVGGWPVTVGAAYSIPLWASWIACVVAVRCPCLGKFWRISRLRRRDSARPTLIVN